MRGRHKDLVDVVVVVVVVVAVAVAVAVVAVVDVVAAFYHRPRPHSCAGPANQLTNDQLIKKEIVNKKQEQSPVAQWLYAIISNNNNNNNSNNNNSNNSNNNNNRLFSS